jgi:hypothetical protein
LLLRETQLADDDDAPRAETDASCESRERVSASKQK